MAKETTSIENQEAETKAAPATAHPNGFGGLAIAAMVVGIVAVLSGWAIFFGLIAGIVAIILAVIALKKKQNKAMSITGLVTGIVAVVWNLIVTIFWAFWFFALMSVGVAANNAANEIQETVNQAQQETQNKVEAKKDFAKGETAVFGDLSVKVNSVNANFTSDDGWSEPSTGKKFISVNLTVTNNSDDNQYISTSTFNVLDGSLVVSTAWVDGASPLPSGSIIKGGSITGDIVYEVSDSSSNWKLQYDDMVVDYSAGEMKTLTYTLQF